MKSHKLFAKIGLLLICLTFAVSSVSFAASETGHSDLMRLLASLYGFNTDVSDLLANINQSVDKVPLSSALISGRASVLLHFASQVTPSDLSDDDINKLMNNLGKRKSYDALLAAMKTQSLTAAGIPYLMNAQSTEMIMEGFRRGDGFLIAMGFHTAIDIGGGFHAGYLGGLKNSVPGLNKLPFIRFLAIGHLTDGTSSDKINLAKFIMTMDALGPFMIALRNSQKDFYGVNKTWLNKLESEGVDIDDPHSIRDWFLNQPEVAKILQDELPASTTETYMNVVLEELKLTIKKLAFFKNAESEEKFYNYIYRKIKLQQLPNQKQNKSIFDIITEAVNYSINNDLFDSQKTLKETTTQVLGQYGKDLSLKETIQMFNLSHDSMPEYAQQAYYQYLKETHWSKPLSQKWFADQITEKITRGMANFSYQKFNNAYTNKKTESTLLGLEKSALQKIEKILFNRTGVYIKNPAIEYWSKIFSSWSILKPTEKGDTIIKKLITFCDLVVSTQIAPDKKFYTPNYKIKTIIFWDALKWLYAEESKAPLTSPGNMILFVKKIRETFTEDLKKDFPDGLITPELVQRYTAHIDFLNKKFNSGEAVGIVQTTAKAVRNKLENYQQKKLQKATLETKSLMCEQLFGL